MNILFANYGDFTTNSLTHIAGFANRLCELGHQCIVAVPQNKQTAQCLESTCYFQAATYGDVLNTPNHFPNGKPADILHAWTPREGVRKFVENYCSKQKTQVIVHLEDNEAHIMESFYRMSSDELKKREKPNGFPNWIDQLSHPLNWKAFCTLADATTTIIDDLFEFSPKDRPRLELFPGTDLTSVQPTQHAAKKRTELGIAENEHIIAYTGGISSANREDIRTLYLAVKLLNDTGYKTKILKTGPSDPSFKESFTFDISQISIDLGIIDKTEIPKILECANVLVQPGKVDEFNRYRLPSKLPEFLAANKPVIATDTNIVGRMEDEVHCLKLKIGSPEEIVDKCIRLLDNPSLAAEIANAGRSFAEKHFSIESNTNKLLEFYELVKKSGSNNWQFDSGTTTPMAFKRLKDLSHLGNTFQPERDSLIESIESKTNSQDRVSKKQISEYKGKIEKLETELKERKKQLQTFQSDRHKEYLASEEAKHSLNQKIDELAEKNVDLERNLTEIKNHFSWKLSSPLRSLSTPPKPSPGAKEIAPSEKRTPKKGNNLQEEKVPLPQPPEAYRDYQNFCTRLQPLIEEYTENFKKRNHQEAYQPIISVILPVYNVEEIWLSKAINSIINQAYGNWELCIADDASPKRHVKEVLEQYSKIDDRIKIVFRTENGHISEASNSALEIATGEYIALLDHDDELPGHALARIVDAIREHPKANVFYSDEDKIDQEGNRSSPHFKSDWNPDLLLGQNFISHLGVYRRSLIEKIGGFRKGFEGAQDWDLVLRASEHCKPNQIVHIPEVLYHWRMIEGSTANDIDDKDYAHQAAGKVLKSHFDRHGINVTLSPVDRYYWKPQYQLPELPPKVSIIIPTRDRIDLLKACIDSIVEKTTYPCYEIVIVNNDSNSPEAHEYFAQIKSSNIKVIDIPGEFNFNALNNAAIKQSDTEVICLMNNDITVITNGWLEELVSHACRMEIGVASPKLYYPHDHIQHAGVIMGIGGIASEAFKKLHKNDDGYIHRACLIGNYSALTAACMVFRKNVWEEAGYMNENDTPNAFGDIDFCLKIGQLGYRCLFTPFAELYHFESASRGNDTAPEKIDAFQKAVSYMETNWSDVIAEDPYYNRNLTLKREDFTLAFPPRGYSIK